MYEDKIKKDLEEIETINIELDHRVSKLIAENEHLKQTYKRLYDSIKPAHIRSKEQCDDLINQDDLRKLKGKALVDKAITKHTINLEMLKIDMEPITPKLLNKRTAHSAYIKHTQEEAAALRDLVDHVKANYPLDHSLESTCRITITTEVPLRKPTSLENETPKPVVTFVYSRKPRKSKTNVHVSKSKVLKSVSANKKEPNQSWGSIVSDVPSSSFDECRSKDEALDIIIKFLKMIQVRLKVPVRRIRTDNRTKFVNQTLREYYEKVGISHETSVARSPQKNGIVKRCNHTLIEAACTMLIYAKDFDELTSMAFEHISSGPVLHEMTPTTISSGLVPNPPPLTPFVPPSRNDWDLLIQPLFDELLTPPPSVDYPAPKVIARIHEVEAPVPAVSTGSPSSTNVDQDAPSLSNSQTTPETHPPIIPNAVKEDNHDTEVAHMGNDPYFGILIPEVHSDQSSSSDIIYIIVHPDHQISEHNSKWTKDHPLENKIGELARLVSKRMQLHEQALFCYYDAFLTAVKPKTYKDAFTQSCWIEAMQEELNEFEHLGVWELVPRPNKVMVITLKWIYKVKLDELEIRGYKDFSAFVAHISRTGLWDPDTHYHVYAKESSLWVKTSFTRVARQGITSVDTPMVKKSKLDEDKEGKAVDPSHYHVMIGTLFYLTASRPDLQFAICMCAWYQARPTEKHLHVIKRIFQYLRGTVNRGLWYPKDSSISLTAFADADHASCQDTRHSTSGCMQFLGDRLLAGH
ncbi:retrovirus-related pol polyprotein from transposon TNT 1-94 [Tanacetum coccineum]